jgi:thioredoxin 1
MATSDVGKVKGTVVFEVMKRLRANKYEKIALLNERLMGFCQNTTSLQRHIRCNSHSNKEKAMASDLIKHTSDATFDADVIKSATPVVVDFWAEWCGPCKMIAPILDDVAGAYQGKLQITKMNVDENRDIPAKYGIRGIPTLMIFKDGQLAATKVGAMSKAQLTAFIDQQLA